MSTIADVNSSVASSCLVEEIRCAFPLGVVPPRPVTEHRCIECDDVDNYLGGRTWQEVADNFPTYCHDSFPLLSREAKAYYLPAFMCFDLTTSQWDAGISLCGSFENGNLAPEQFDVRQRTAIAHWMQWYQRENPEELAEDIVKRWNQSVAPASRPLATQ